MNFVGSWSGILSTSRNLVSQPPPLLSAGTNRNLTEKSRKQTCARISTRFRVEGYPYASAVTMAKAKT